MKNISIMEGYPDYIRVKMIRLADPLEKEKVKQLRLVKKQYRAFLQTNQPLVVPQVMNDAAIVDLVKKNILIAAGQAAEDPKKLFKEMELANLLPTSAAYQFLADLLDELVKAYKMGAKVKVGEVNDCATVGDCIQLVISKL